VRTRAEEAAMIAALQAHPPRYLVMDTTQSSFDWVPWASRTPELWRWVMRVGVLEAQFGRFALLRNVGDSRPRFPLHCARAACAGRPWRPRPDAIEADVLLPPGRYAVEVRTRRRAHPGSVTWTGPGGDGEMLLAPTGHGGRYTARVRVDRLATTLRVAGTGLRPGDVRTLHVRRPSRRHAFEFDDLDGVELHMFDIVGVEHGVARLRPMGQGGGIVLVPLHDDANVRRVDVRMKVGAGAFGQVFVQTEANPQWTLMRRFPLAGSKAFVTYRVPLDGWFDESRATAVRLDPTDRSGAAVAIDSLHILGNGFAR
jgi:hypothetical protein